MAKDKNSDRLEEKTEGAYWAGIFLGGIVASMTLSVVAFTIYQDMLTQGYTSFVQYYNEVIVPGLEHFNEALYLGL